MERRQCLRDDWRISGEPASKGGDYKLASMRPTTRVSH
jgi:hypothetical protein